MGEVLAQVNVAQVGASGILAFLVLLVLLGRLVPRKTLEDLRADKNEQLAATRAERDTWKQAALDEAATCRALQAQNGELLELARTAGHVLTSLPTGQEVTASAPVAQLPAAPTL